MININLLPWRAELRKKHTREFKVRSGLAALSAVIVAAAGYMYFSNQLSEQEQVNQMIMAENAHLDEKLKDLQDLEITRGKILERMKLINDLQGQRPVIVRIADEIVRITPQELYFTSFERKGNKFTLKGLARDPNVVAELLRSLENSPWFRNAFMNSFTAKEEKNAQSNAPATLTSLVQRPEVNYGTFEITVDLDDVSKTIVADSNEMSATGNANMPQSVDSQAQPAAQPVEQQPASQPAAQSAPAQPESQHQAGQQPSPKPDNGQANPPTPNNQGAK